MGTPMECPPPRTRETVGILKDAIISAMASPASTSPPTVFKRIRSPSISSSSSIRASFGNTCSYLVVLLCDGADSWPSISPITVRSSTLCFREFPSSTTCPVSWICLSWLSSRSSSFCFPSSLFFSIKNTSGI